MVEFQWHSFLALLVFLIIVIVVAYLYLRVRYGIEHLDSYKISIEYMLISIEYRKIRKPHPLQSEWRLFETRGVCTLR